MKTEILAQITAPHFTVGIVLIDDVVTLAAPTVGYMRRWSRDRVRKYCEDKNWQVEIVRQREAPPS
jgi:hypothetical protein